MNWTAIHTQAINEYYWCYSASTSAETRNYLFEKVLLKPIQDLIDIRLRQHNLYTDDNIQDALIYVYNCLNKLKADKLQAAEQFIYVSLKNFCINIYRLNSIKVSERNTSCIDDYDFLDESRSTTDSIDFQIEVLQEIDRKIREQEIINKRNSIFLLHLKEYLINNSFDEREFNVYVQEKMQINNSMYRAIAHRCRISTLYLNKKKIEKT